MDTMITMLLAAQWDDQDPVTLDEVITAVKTLAMQQSLPTLLAALLQRWEARLLARWEAGTLAPPACCAAPQYARHDRLPRTLRTSLGPVAFQWHRLQCRRCHHSWVPLRDELQLRPHQAKTRELEHQVIEACSAQSYRRVATDWAAHHHLPLPKSTLHYWVRISRAATLPPGPTRVPTVLADATLYAQQPRAARGDSRHGELRLLYALTRTDRLQPLGVWSDVAWHTIGHQVEATGLHALALVCDGEPGLAEGLAPLVTAMQRCHWHLVHALDSTLLADGVAKATRRQWQQRLHDILALQLPPGTPTTCPPAALTQFRRALAHATAEVAALLADAQAQGYRHTITYLHTAQPYVFTYAQLWLRYGVRVPRVTTRLEAVMRLIKRRLRHLATNWTPGGAQQISQFILKQAHCAHAWWAEWHPTGRRQHTLRLASRIGST
jgi:hypothetical protein